MEAKVDLTSPPKQFVITGTTGYRQEAQPEGIALSPFRRSAFSPSAFSVQGALQGTPSQSPRERTTNIQFKAHLKKWIVLTQYHIKLQDKRSSL